jgi:hypothetical protein
MNELLKQGIDENGIIPNSPLYDKLVENEEYNSMS